MATIVTRAGKGSPLTHNEVDANFNNLNSDKVETSSVSAFGATLIDDADAATARTTLGLGTAATTASTDYATAAQGALADSAVQPNDSPTFGSITVTGTVDGRDVSVDGAKLDGIEAGADVTDAANVEPLVDTHLNTGTAATGEFLSWNGADYDWATVPAGYTDADVDTHLNTGTAAAGEVLSWTGADYDWVTVAAGATGGGSDEIFWENGQTVTTNYTITNGKNAMSAGPITINTGVTVTVGAGEVWTVV